MFIVPIQVKSNSIKFPLNSNHVQLNSAASKYRRWEIETKEATQLKALFTIYIEILKRKEESSSFKPNMIALD